MTFVDLVAAVLGRDISGVPPATPMSQLGFTSKELVILLTRMEQETGRAIDFDVLATLSSIESFAAVVDASEHRSEERARSGATVGPPQSDAAVVDASEHQADHITSQD